jgi:hypothetical protein
MTGHPSPQRLSELETAAGQCRRELLEHVRDCAECRATVLAEEPSRLFALLSLDAVPPEILDRLSRRLGERPAAPRRAARPFGAMLSLAASIVLAGFLGAYLLSHPPLEIATLDAPPPADPVWVSSRPPEPRDARHAGPIHGVELLSSPGAGTLVNLSVGETRVVMIFDEALKL